MKLEQRMQQPVVKVGVDDDLGRAAQLLWEHDCGALVVVDIEGKLAGMVTDRDLCMAAWTRGLPLSAIPVRTAMASNVVRCRASDSDEDAARLMASHQIRRLPIVDADDRPLGLVALADLARAAATARDPAAARRVTETLAAVSRRREAEPARAVGKTATSSAGG